MFYHFVHALGMLVVSGWQRTDTNGVCWLLAAGVLLFSGSLYALAVTRNLTFGAIRPLGGVAYIAAWLLLACFSCVVPLSYQPSRNPSWICRDVPAPIVRPNVLKIRP